MNCLSFLSSNLSKASYNLFSGSYWDVYVKAYSHCPAFWRKSTREYAQSLHSTDFPSECYVVVLKISNQIGENVVKGIAYTDRIRSKKA